jgi:hypothetical protein
MVSYAPVPPQGYSFEAFTGAVALVFLVAVLIYVLIVLFGPRRR